MTYREAIQNQIDALQTIYDNCEGLRDAADEDEKEVWNYLRASIPPLFSKLQKLDNKLNQSRAAFKLQGIYHVNTH